MNAENIAKKATDFIFPFLSKNKAIEQITGEVKEAANTSLLELWEKISPIFIEEFIEDGQLQEDIENKDIVTREIRKILKSDGELMDFVEDKIKKLEEDDILGKIVVQNSKNVAAGNKIEAKGDVIIGGQKTTYGNGGEKKT